MRLVERRYHEFVLAFALPGAVVLAAFAACGVYPFGDTSVFLWDMNIQYAGFFGWLTEVLQGEGNLFYAASKGLGGGMVALFAYYLSSPFNVLAAFFDASQVPQLLSWLTVLKIAAAGLSCYVFLRMRYRAGLLMVLCASAYATCAYTLGYCSNIMWLDGVIMLPLVALGVERAVRRQRYGVLFASVLAAILANWYTAWMLCLFSVLFFVFELAALFGFSWRGRAREALRAAGRYALCMVLALGASAVLFLPAAIGLMQGKGGGFDLGQFLTPGFPLNPFDFFNYFVIGSEVGAEIREPALWISALMLVCASAFFLDGGVGRRRRAAYGVLLAVIGVSFFYITFADVWTGFIRSSSYNHRQSFVFLFVLVMVAAEEIVRTRESRDGSCTRRFLAAALIVDALILASTFNVWYRVREAEPGGALIAAELVLLPLFALLLAAVLSPAAGKALSRGALAVLVVAFAAEQGTAATLMFSKYRESAGAFGAYTERMEEVYGSLERENGYLRVGQAAFNYLGADPLIVTDESLIYGVGGLNHYSSTMSGSAEMLSVRLGYCKYSIFGIAYNSPLLVGDSLLGLRYVLDDVKPPASEPVEGAPLPYRGFAVYENTRALPLGYGVAKGAGETSIAWTDDPFENQEALLGAMAGESAADLYTPEVPVAVGPVGPGADHATGLTWNVEVSRTGPLYIHTPLINTRAENEGGIWTDLYVNGAFVQMVGGRFSGNVVYAGDFAQGDQVEIRLVPRQPGQSFTDEKKRPITAAEVFAKSDDPAFLHVETLDVAEFDRLSAKLHTEGFAVDAFADGAVDATYHAEGAETLLLTIPYDEGWTASVNGTPVPIARTYDSLMSVQVAPGENKLELRYTPPGLLPGAIISLVSLAAAAMLATARGWRQRKATAS